MQFWAGKFESAVGVIVLFAIRLLNQRLQVQRTDDHLRRHFVAENATQRFHAFSGGNAVCQGQLQQRGFSVSGYGRFPTTCPLFTVNHRLVADPFEHKFVDFHQGTAVFIHNRHVKRRHFLVITAVFVVAHVAVDAARQWAMHLHSLVRQRHIKIIARFVAIHQRQSGARGQIHQCRMQGKAGQIVAELLWQFQHGQHLIFAITNLPQILPARAKVEVGFLFGFLLHRPIAYFAQVAAGGNFLNVIGWLLG